MILYLLLLKQFIFNMNGHLFSSHNLSPNSLFSGTKKFVPPNAATLFAYEFVIQLSISISN